MLCRLEWFKRTFSDDFPLCTSTDRRKISRWIFHHVDRQAEDPSSRLVQRPTRPPDKPVIRQIVEVKTDEARSVIGSRRRRLKDVRMVRIARMCGREPWSTPRPVAKFDHSVNACSRTSLGVDDHWQLGVTREV